MLAGAASGLLGHPDGSDEVAARLTDAAMRIGIDLTARRSSRT
jgi:hypothetical protein